MDFSDLKIDSFQFERLHCCCIPAGFNHRERLASQAQCRTPRPFPQTAHLAWRHCYGVTPGCPQIHRSPRNIRERKLSIRDAVRGKHCRPGSRYSCRTKRDPCAKDDAAQSPSSRCFGIVDPQGKSKDQQT